MQMSDQVVAIDSMALGRTVSPAGLFVFGWTDIR